MQLFSAAAPGIAPATLIDGDASSYLEDLVVGELESLPVPDPSDRAIEVEIVGPHLRLSGAVSIGAFRRLSDFLNHHEGLFELRDATILRRNGEPTKVTARSVWLSPQEVTLIGQPSIGETSTAPPDVRVIKEAKGLIVVTPGHTLTGQVFITSEASLSAYIESMHPPYIPMTDVRTRSLADRRVTSRYEFAMLNRRHIVAATELQPGMAPAGHDVL